MRWSLCASILTISALVARPAAAQWSGLTATLGGGVTFPMGTTGDNNKTGGNGTFTIGYHPTDSHHTFSIEAGFHQLLQITDPADNIGKAHSNILVVMGRYDHDLGQLLYVTGGVGMVHHEFKQRMGTLVLTNTDSRPGIAGGAGLTFSKRFFVEGRVVYSFAKPDATVFVPVTVGIRF